MVRLLASSAAIALTGLAIASAPPALATPLSSGMSADFPIGRCIDIPDRVLDDDGNLQLNSAFNLRYVSSVPCTDPARNYRVIAQVPQESLCGSETSRVFITRDLVTLCTVQDPPALGAG